MKKFTHLIWRLDASNSTRDKKQALLEYLQEADEQDRVWAIALFTHRRPKRAVPTPLLRRWAAELAGIPLWLFEESYHIAGDLAETISLVLPSTSSAWSLSLHETMKALDSLRTLPEEEKENWVKQSWMAQSTQERFVFNKLMTGGFRIGVSENLMHAALAELLNCDVSEAAMMLTGDWNPFNTTFDDLVLGKTGSGADTKPYPFYLAYALDTELQSIGILPDWQVEWKWDGIRGQLIHRNGIISLWSRGEELVTERFPELTAAGAMLPDGTAIDGEILAWKQDLPLPFQQLQTRIGRKKPGKKLLNEVPVIFMAYDLLEHQGKDIRSQPLLLRRTLLEQTIKNTSAAELRCSPLINADTWESLVKIRSTARESMVEGLMLKHRQSLYQSGRKKGEWWKWKTDPYTLDLVLIYAQRGHGRRANLYTDFTFAARNEEGGLTTLTKAYSGLTDQEFEEVNRFIRAKTLESFGPVRSVVPELVFELAFEGINQSSRNKSGFALRFPRIVRWRKDKQVEEINTLEEVEAMWEQSYQGSEDKA